MWTLREKVEPLRKWIQEGKPIWGTCAGMILMANKLTGKMKEGQKTIGGLDATVYRNYFGSQLGSFSAQLENQIGKFAWYYSPSEFICVRKWYIEKPNFFFLLSLWTNVKLLTAG
jgi:glutamine amidotransferase PdxT